VKPSYERVKGSKWVARKKESGDICHVEGVGCRGRRARAFGWRTEGLLHVQSIFTIFDIEINYIKYKKMYFLRIGHCIKRNIEQYKVVQEKYKLQRIS
jgi:hypothetical protein